MRLETVRAKYPLYYGTVQGCAKYAVGWGCGSRFKLARDDHTARFFTQRFVSSTAVYTEAVVPPEGVRGGVSPHQMFRT